MSSYWPCPHMDLIAMSTWPNSIQGGLRRLLRACPESTHTQATAFQFQ